MSQKRIMHFLSEIHEFFLDAAKEIQNGGAEYSESKKWLNIWWPADELQLIHLCTEDRLKAFYQEAEGLLQLVTKEKFIELPSLLIQDAIRLNQNLIKLPFQTEDLKINLSYNIWEFYQNFLIGIDIPIEETSSDYLIDRTSDTWSSWEQWCQEVIWYGNKKGAYLYTIQQMKAKVPISSSYSQQEIAGHH